MENAPRIPQKELSQSEFLHFFISHLHRIYCAKSQLAEKLPELGKRSYFLDLQQAIGETVEIVQLQIQRMREIYVKLDSFYQSESCIGLVGILDEAFQSIGTPGESASVRDLSVLFYMQHIESIEMASFKVLLMVADKLAETEIVQLLQECYDEAREDKALFKEIIKNYIQ
jgi:ferritin-like metal-binding protein YciE